MDDAQPLRAGSLALVGSGEYTPAMEDTDRFLLETLGGPAAARVAVIPTASALEPGMPARWNQMGAEHFTALGALVTPLLLLDRADAAAEQVVAALDEANFYYFSGGDPQYSVETLRDTPAWDTIRRRQAAGAVLAGCSAGAMMLGGYTLAVRELVSGRPPEWLPALGLLPTIAVMPHFDRVAQFVGAELFRAIVASAPPGITLVGIDEDTALIASASDTGSRAWRVIGRQSVSIFGAGGRRVYQAGEQVPPLAS
jgi:cyanophycinase